MATVGLREFRQQVGALVRRAENGEVTTITVSGRPAARLVPASPRSWRRFEEISSLFAGPGDPVLEAPSIRRLNAPGRTPRSRSRSGPPG